MKILLVNDDINILNLLEDILKPTGHEIFVLDEIDSILKIIRNDKFDLMIIDFNMNLIEGIKILKEIRKINKKIKIILLLEDDTFHFSIYLNIFLCLVKPIIIRKLFDAIDEINRVNIYQFQNKDTKENIYV